MISDTISFRNILPNTYQAASQKIVTNFYTRAAFYLGIALTVCLIGFITLLTTPFWVPAMFLSLPFIVVGYIAFKYTKVLDPVIQLYWRLVFDALSWYYPGTDLTHLNAGYADISDDGIFITDLQAHQEIYHIQLYHFTVLNLGNIRSLKDASMLETGCGRGGGFNYLMNTLKPARAVGTDISGQCINFCKNNWADFGAQDMDVNFQRCASEDISKRFGKKSFDCVVDIENTLFYADVGRFLRNVNDVLKDDGTFFLADTRPAGLFESLEREIKKYFDIQVKEDITTRIQQALALDSPRLKKIIEDNYPIIVQPFLKQGFVLKGTYLHRQLEKKNWLYKAYVLTKKKDVNLKSE